ncbi:MAG TPA: replication-associated recombination protein A, partial [Nannocystis sp.]
MPAPSTDPLLDHAWQRDPGAVPLAERMRPRNLGEFAGQAHLVGPGRMLARVAETGRVPSLIFWGPPGVGKTTLARLLAEHTRSHFVVLSATAAGVKELREVVEQARRRRAHEGRGTLLFVDEIHRFNKGQQDVLLPHLEAGACALVGATTENPSFEVNAALLSRVRVLQLRPLAIADIVGLMRRALADRERGLGAREITVDEGLLAAIAHTAQGDARRALNSLELAVDLLPDDEHVLGKEVAAQAVGARSLRYDRAGEEHYNVVSAFIKSMRASDADAAVYWLARMLEAGEDVDFVARRLVIFASEDVGNADPRAISVASACYDIVERIGMPEAKITLAQAVVYMATAPKSNRSYAAINAAIDDVKHGRTIPVPKHLRDGHYAGSARLGHGKGYKYAHDYAGGYVAQDYLGVDKTYYEP